MTLRRLPLLLVGLTLAACSAAEPSLHDYRLRHPLAVEMRPHTASLTGVSAPGVAAVAQDYLRQGRGPMTVSVLTSDENDVTARGMAASTADLLQSNGVPAAAIKLQLLVDPAIQGQSLSFDYQRVQVVLPKCPDFSGETGGPGTNANSSNFGCAMQNNVGAMVANPQDLLQGQPFEGHEAIRSQDVYGKWAAGAETTSPPVQGWRAGQSE